MAANERAYVVQELHALRQAACDPRLSRGDIAVYAVILSHCNADGEAFPGKIRIARMAHIHEKTVLASIGKLERLGYLFVEKRGQRRTNLYQIGDPDPVKSGSVGTARGKRNPTGSKGESGSVGTASCGNPSGSADTPQSGGVGAPHLVVPTLPYKSNSLLTHKKNSPCASRNVSSETEEQKQKRLQRERESYRSAYLSLLTRNSPLAREWEENKVFRQHIEDLIPKARQPGGGLPPLTA